MAYSGVANYYGYDSMGRLQYMSGNSIVSGATYGPAGELLSATYPFGTETRQYNARLQLTRITVPSQVDLEYRYAATTNNGQITQLKNWISGEEVNYTYDSLSQLSTAVTTGSEWGLSFSYDGFGNRLSQTPTKGTAPSSTVAVDGTTNRVVGHTYDSRGNTLAMPGISGMSYDAANRVLGVTSASDQYRYAPDNRRIYKNGQIFFYGADGKMLGVYTIQVTTSISFCAVQTFQYFGCREIRQKRDRLESVLTGSRYYPYGEEYPATANDKPKFTGYWRDTTTTLDVGHNRYYQSALGRFVTAP